MLGWQLAPRLHRCLWFVLLTFGNGACGEFYQEGMRRPPSVRTFAQRPALPIPGTVAMNSESGELPLVAPPGDQGRIHTETLCTPCHGSTGRGDGPVGPYLRIAPPPYSRPRLQTAPDSHWVRVIRNGFRSMWGYADKVDESQARDIAKRARRLGRETRPAPQRGAP